MTVILVINLISIMVFFINEKFVRYCILPKDKLISCVGKNIFMYIFFIYYKGYQILF